jgi:hypothetical protein
MVCSQVIVPETVEFKTIDQINTQFIFSSQIEAEPIW